MTDINTLLSRVSEYDVFEGMTSISAVIKSIKNGSSDRRMVAVLYDATRADKKSRELTFLKNNAVSLGFEMVDCGTDIISSICMGDTHGGIVAITTKRTFSGDFVNKLTSGSFFALIEGIEDPYNFGYSIRSLYAAGADGIILPPRNWMEFSGAVARSSAGTSELSNIYVSDPYIAAKTFKEHGFEVVCATIRDSVSIYEYDFNKPILLVVGGEKRGISRKILELSDANIRIDYGRDFMGSLPSASAVSVIAFEIARQKSLFRV